MKHLLKISMAISAVLLLAAGAQAETPNQEIHILPDGQIHLINADLYTRHASNLYTVKNWGIKWVIPIEITDTKLKIESAYGYPITLLDILEKHVLEIKGQALFDKNTNEYQIYPSLIRDLSLKIGEPPAVQPVAAPIVSAVKQQLTKYLKIGSKGNEVKILQEFLKKQKLFPENEPPSGYFGPLTKKALMDFQTANSLEAVGMVGPKTRPLINSILAQ